MLNNLLKKIIIFSMVFFTIPLSSYANDFEIAGSRGAIKATLTPHKDKISRDASVNLKLNASGSSKGLRNLIQGKADLAVLSASVDSVIPKVNKKYNLNAKLSDFEQITISEQTLGIIVNKNNKVDTLTRTQLHDIFVGKIKNWSEVGGDDREIILLPGRDGSGVRSLMEKTLLKKGEKFAKGRSAPSNVSLKFVADNVGGITAGSLSYVSDSLKVIKITEGGEISQRYYLISKGSFAGKKAEVRDIIIELNK